MHPLAPPRISLDDSLKSNPELISEAMLKAQKEMEEDDRRNTIRTSAREAAIHCLKVDGEVPEEILSLLFY